ncbi:hypothetical protein [Leucobacter ruminantium]|uniref:Uncharacterized protein n=1 Tax=Leucobacter ruminantium TaxID=1289170 RepID=A0A939LWU2_9MICO|nr:hypothetical protein [Leucobacter ruminantium]MBO1805887.1 hypothetical protein [Leucobacter ruminantium]
MLAVDLVRERVGALNAAPKMKTDRETGVEVQAVDRETGIAQWTVQALHSPKEGKATLLNVTVTSEFEPEIQPMVTGFASLEVDMYTIKENGVIKGAGLWFRGELDTQGVDQ